MATEMEWCRGNRASDAVAPRDPDAWIRFQSQERCKQWGVDAVDSFGSLDKSSLGNKASEFSCETLMDELEMDCVVGERDDDEEMISGVRGGVSESSNCWTTLLNYQDFRLDGFPGTNQTDENFVNSLIVDDMRVGDQFQVHDSPKSQGSYEHPESDVSHQSLSSMMKNVVVTQYNAPIETFKTPQRVIAGRRIHDRPSVEETVLQELGSTMQKMTNKTRLSFRDAFYRLAINSDKDSSKFQGKHGDDRALSENDSLISESADTESEYQDNAIDRTIADLMLNMAYH